jgi:hypothetical protein
VPIEIFVPFSLQLIDIFKVFFLATFAKLVRHSDELMLALRVFSGVRNDLGAASFAFERALGTLKNLLHGLDLFFPFLRVLFILATFQFLVERDYVSHGTPAL